MQNHGHRGFCIDAELPEEGVEAGMTEERDSSQRKRAEYTGTLKGTISPWRFTVPVSGRYIPLIPLSEHRKPICSTDYYAGLRA